MMPVMADAALESLRLLAAATAAFTERCLAGMEADAGTCRAEVERSPAMATALNPYIGYEQAAKLAREALATGKTVRQLAREKKILPDDVLQKALDPWRMIGPSRGERD
jgi:fumarate hydratase class II